MERKPGVSRQEFFEANRGKNVLSITQKVLTPDFKLTTHTQSLVVGSPKEVKLSENLYTTFNIWTLSNGQEVRQKFQGHRLKNSILHLAKSGQIVLIFDTDDLNLPYLEYLSSVEMLKAPFSFTQLDAHFDIGDLKGRPSKNKGLDSLFAFYQKRVGIGNFLTAMAATGHLKKLVHVNPQKLMVRGGFPPELYSNIKTYGVEFQYVSPYFKFFNRFPSLFKGEDPTVLAFDIDFFGVMAALNRRKRTVLETTEIYLNLLKENGYSAKKCPVVCLATSPGFNDGFRDDDEKLELISQIIDNLDLH